jgi:hypothetical protein
MNQLEIINCEQNSPEWHRARMGIPTASCFDAILTPGKTQTQQKTRRTYLLKLAGELLTGQPIETVMTRDMERGHLLEPEARDLYTLQAEASLDRVGFVRRGRVGCSPDSLIGEDGGLEIKTKAPHLLIEIMLKDEFPEEHKAQVQGALWITGRKWWDIAVYWPGLPLFVKRAFRDEPFIANMAAEVERFRTDLDCVVTDMQQRVMASLPEWNALKDLTPSAELLASRIVSETVAAHGVDLTAVDTNGFPIFLKRAPEPEFDDAKWLAEIQREFDKTVDLIDFGKTQQTLMAPFKSRVAQDSWKKAVKLATKAMARLMEEPQSGSTLAVAAE